MEGDSYELRNRDYPLEEEDPAQEEETSFSVLENNMISSYMREAPDAPTFDPAEYSRTALQREELSKIRKNTTLSEYFKNELKISTSSSAGEKSEELYKNSELILNKRSGKITGLEFKGKRIIVKKNQFTKDRRLVFNIQEFNDILKKAEEEYQNTTSSVIEEEIYFTPPKYAVENIIENTLSSIISRVEELESEVENTPNLEESLSPQEMREVMATLRDGVLSQNISSYEKINALEVEKKHWEEKKIKSTDQYRKTLFEALEKITKLKLDTFYIDEDRKPESEEGLELLREEARNNDLVRFEKFKKWAKENLVGLSAIAITIGGIITTVVMASRRTLKQGASAFAKFANAVAKAASKAGPILSTLFGIIATALKWGAKGLIFLANNLWVLAVAIAYAIIETRKKRKKQ